MGLRQRLGVASTLVVLAGLSVPLVAGARPPQPDRPFTGPPAPVFVPLRAVIGPHVALSSVGSLPAAARAGRTYVLRGSLLNDGSAPASGPVVVHLLRPDAAPVAIGRTALTLAAHSSGDYSVRVRLPRVLRDGSYAVVACARLSCVTAERHLQIGPRDLDGRPRRADRDDLVEVAARAVEVAAVGARLGLGGHDAVWREQLDRREYSVRDQPTQAAGTGSAGRRAMQSGIEYLAGPKNGNHRGRLGNVDSESGHESGLHSLVCAPRAGNIAVALHAIRLAEAGTRGGAVRSDYLLRGATLAGDEPADVFPAGCAVFTFLARVRLAPLPECESAPGVSAEVFEHAGPRLRAHIVAVLPRKNYRISPQSRLMLWTGGGELVNYAANFAGQELALTGQP